MATDCEVKPEGLGRPQAGGGAKRNPCLTIMDHGDGSRGPLFAILIVLWSFQDNSPLSISAYHVDATRQLPKSTSRDVTAQHTSASQVIDAIGAGGILHT